MDPLLLALARVRRRLLAVRALEAGLAGAIGGGALAAAVTLIRILRPQAMPLALAQAWLPLALVPLGFAAALAVRLAVGATLRQAALAADRAAGLRERLATALEVLQLHRGGQLDDRLLDQACAAAAAIDPAHLPLAASAGRRARVLLVGLLVLAAGAFVPPLGGPPLAPEAAQAAADALQQVARQTAVAPAIRREIERAVRNLRASGARQGDAGDAMSAVYEAAARADQARRGTLKALAGIDDPDFRRVVRQAAGGDAAGAAGAASDLADRLGAEPGSGGMPLADRERLADGLTGAAPAAEQAGMTDLAARIAAAAEAVRRPGTEARDALGQLAATMATALPEPGAGGVAAVVDAVDRARRTLGLPEAPPAGLAHAGGVAPGQDAAAQGTAATRDLPRGVGAGATESVTGVALDDVRAEDRDVVRRYFGG